MELTAEQLEKAQTMPLEDLRALAIREAEEATAQPAAVPAAGQPRDEKGQFKAADTGKDELDNSGDLADAPADPADPEEATPSRTIYRKEIDNADGSGVDVYEADTLEELVDKIAEGKKNANKKIRELNLKVKAETVKVQQTTEDEEFLISEKLKKNPKQTMKEIAAEVLREQADATARSQAVQNQFVATHPDYVANPANGEKLVAWHKTHGYTEFTTEGLEKAYQDLKKSGLLVLKTEEAGDATDVDDTATQRTAEPKSEATQQRSQKKSSTISTRNRPTVANKVEQFSEDEAYALPLEEVRKRADAQLAANRQE